MKSKVHPKYEPATITCACGNVIKTYSTVPKMRVEICSKCHPFYTKKQKLVDTAGMVDKFRERQEKTKQLQKEKGKKKDKKVKKQKEEKAKKEKIKKPKKIKKAKVEKDKK